MTTTKQTPQEKLLAYIAAQGWSLDPTVTINTYRRWGFSDLPAEEKAKYIKPHPHAFTKPASDGGRWQIWLDYSIRSDYGGRLGTRLHSVEITKFDADGERVSLDGINSWGGRIKLQRPSTSRYVYRREDWVWDATDPLTDDNESDGTLAKRVERLASNIELVLWLAAELKYNSDVRFAAQIAEQQRDRELRSRPLPDGWDVLKTAARAVVSADGLSDPVALIAALREGIAAVENKWAAAVQ